MALTVLAARAAGIAVLDGVHNDLDDTQALRPPAQTARDFGFDGKSVIHPSQIGAANQAFTPTPDEVAYARRVLAAFAGRTGQKRDHPGSAGWWRRWTRRSPPGVTRRGRRRERAGPLSRAPSPAAR